MPESRAPLPGTERKAAPGAVRVGDAASGDRVTVSVVLKPPAPSRPGQEFASAGELAAVRGAPADAVSAVRSFAAEHGLTVDRVDEAARTVTLSGTVAAMNGAFGVSLGRFASAAGGDSYRGRTGEIQMPTSLVDAVQVVLGLDDRPAAQPHFQIRPQPIAGGDVDLRAAGGTFAPTELAAIYDFPPKTTGRGQTIAIVELGGGFRPADLTTYFGHLGVKKPSVTAVSVDGAKNAPVGDPNSADGEVVLDIEVAGAVAPGAKIAVYFAPNTTRGFYDGIAAAIHDTKRKPSVISISWGQAEAGWTPAAMDAYDQLFADAAALGITVLAAAGDAGSTDGATDGKAHVDFPASSPHVVGCGGTNLVANGSAIVSETVWNANPTRSATGGGVSDHFAVPTYQSGIHVPPSANPGKHNGRGVPDVAGVADPRTGYAVHVDGHDLVFGGTSAVAPLWAGLVARLNQQLKRRVGGLHNPLYGGAGAKACHDITNGDNGQYHAASGWDPCTGWGSPRGKALLDALK
ncbi:MAG: kumamolisin [Acidimicrobiaceae bacterium]|nr:kumamolisin [Acidimicrobiaceae bacterium]